MKVLTVRNVHQALPEALRLLYATGIERQSRNGQVLQSPEPVTTVYTHPCERVLFWPERDANPFLHLYESLWMLAGRNDVAPLKRYSKQFEAYTDDGATFHGAYGYRWRKHFDRFRQLRQDGYDGIIDTFDQLPIIIDQLKRDPTDRRCVLAMWDASVDLGRQGKDLPCNDTATFQIGPDGRLDLVMFCRSNDIIWGAYGANAVHFSFLLEYMAARIGVVTGTYTQVSVNWHGYLSTLEKVKPLMDDNHMAMLNPYSDGHVRMLPFDLTDEEIGMLLTEADRGFPGEFPITFPRSGFCDVAFIVLWTHHLWKTKGKDHALDTIKKVGHEDVDWVVAAREWLERRKTKVDGNPL